MVSNKAADLGCCFTYLYQMCCFVIMGNRALRASGQSFQAVGNEDRECLIPPPANKIQQEHKYVTEYVIQLNIRRVGTLPGSGWH